LIDSRIRTYSPHPYLGLYDGYAHTSPWTYKTLAADALLFQLGNTNQKELKIIAHFCRSVKWLEPLSLGRTVWIAIADQVIQLSGIPSIPSTPDYVPVHDCPHCCKI